MPELPPDLVPWANGLGAVLLVLWGAFTYARERFKKKDEIPKSMDVAVVGGALADRASMTELARAVDELRQAIMVLADAMKKSNEMHAERTQEEHTVERILQMLDRRRKLPPE